jgi:hypothetical protein
MSYDPPPNAPAPLALRIIAEIWELSRRSKEGANWPRVTDEVAFPAAVVTTTDTGPVVLSSGAWTLICVGLT